MIRNKLWRGLLCVTLCMVMAVALLCGGCGSEGTKSEARFHVTASFYPIYVMLLNITEGLDDVELSLMAPSETGCLHDYQMTTRDAALLEKSDALVLNGAGMEAFVDESTLKIPLVEASLGQELLQEGDETNGHLWLNPRLAAAEARTIAQGLARLDSVNAEAYQRNAEAYAVKLEKLAARMEERLSAAKGAKLVAFHEAYAYLAQELGLEIVATLSSDHQESPSAGQLAELAALATQEGVKAILAERQYAQLSAETLSQETGIPVYTLDTLSTPPEGSAEDDPEAYLKGMEENLKVLEEALLP